jgi:hypothetical protein
MLLTLREEKGLDADWQRGEHRKGHGAHFLFSPSSGKNEWTELRREPG